ncbi:hypothetical protein Pyn_07771 [Prunus yedoensis var. nudiflora]|uniref:Uncharacterized protein n=1 Tax=Prunus yedoensis var. nudiflora TaxID=2094558 RepID=A0A314UL16_PRUYE|nr:hypothetical protein Pyn_07771 [Prunus yedoensis var. nudiflora]
MIPSLQQFDSMLQVMREGFNIIHESLTGLNQNQNYAITMAVEASYNKTAELLQQKSISPRKEGASFQAIVASIGSSILFQGQLSVHGNANQNSPFSFLPHTG